MVKATKESRLSREAWTDAALDAIAVGGIEAVAVEPLAVQLGATKGSFYWHFKSRAELLEAAMQRWETIATNHIIGQVSTNPEPLDRLRHLLALIIGDAEGNASEYAIFGSVNDPIVAAGVARVNAARMNFLETTFVDLGFSRAVARTRARIAYSTYLGHITLQMADPRAVRSAKAYRDELIVMLTAR